MNSPHESLTPASRQPHQIPWHRLFALAVILLPSYISASSQSPAPSPAIMTDYERFKDETTVGVSTTLESYSVAIPLANMQEFLTLFAGFTHRGQRLTAPPETVKLAFQSQARTWRFADAPELYGIVDGERVALGRMSNSRQDLGAEHIEILRLSVPTSTFLKLARAKTADIRVGTKEVRLTAQHLAALAALADSFTKSPGRQQSPAVGSAARMTAHATQPLSAPTPSLPAVQAAPGPVSPPTRCPIRLVQLLPFRGFRLGMTLNEVNERFRGGTPLLSRANSSGVRSMGVDLSKPDEVPGSTGLIRLEFKFFDDRLYRIEGTYVIGKEWKRRPMSEFAEALSRGLGAMATWVEEPDIEFSAACGEVRFDLAVDEDSVAIAPAGRETPIADAFFTVTDTTAEGQVKQRGDASRRREKELDIEKRKVFKP
jgi:hypothetical protein